MKPLCVGAWTSFDDATRSGESSARLPVGVFCKSPQSKKVYCYKVAASLPLTNEKVLQFSMDTFEYCATIDTLKVFVRVQPMRIKSNVTSFSIH